MNAKCNWPCYFDNKVIKRKVNIRGIVWKHAALQKAFLHCLHCICKHKWSRLDQQSRKAWVIQYFCILYPVCQSSATYHVLHQFSYFHLLFCHIKDKKVTSPSSLCVFCFWKQHYPKFPCLTSILQKRTKIACHSQTTSVGRSMLLPVRHACQTGNRGQILRSNVIKMTPSCCS